MRYLLCAALAVLPLSPSVAGTTVLGSNGITVTVYDNRAEWLAALGTGEVRSEGFEDAKLAPGLTLQGTDYTFDGTLHQTLRNTANYLSMDFASGAKAFAFDYTLVPREGAEGLSLSYNFELDNIYTSITSPSGFYGAITSAPLLSLGFEARKYRTQEYRLDNMNFQLAGVPEPVTWSMLIVGFGAVGGTLRARRRAVAYS